VSALERHCRWLLLAYPAWYRRERAGEMLGTLLEASPPGRRWPTFRDARALVIGSFRVRGWVWLLSMLWVGAGAVEAGYSFYVSTKPYPGIDLGIVGWAETPVTLQIVLALAIFILLAALIPVPIAGFIRLRGWRRGNRLRAAAWAGSWIVGVALNLLASFWEQYPFDSCHNQPGAVSTQCPSGSPAVVSWGELPICAAFLVLGILMTWILAVPPARRSDASSTSGQGVGKAS
jgi:hypothetical protein